MLTRQKSMRTNDEKRADNQAQALLRKSKLETLVTKRKSNIVYLKKTIEGGIFWMNICLLTIRDIDNYSTNIVPKQRALIYYYLSLSLEHIFSTYSAGTLLRSASQLLEEYDYYASNQAIQSMRSMLAKTSPCAYPQALMKEIEDELQQQQLQQPFKPNIYKFQNIVVYEQLKTPHIAFDLDYVEVVIALCDSLYKLYDLMLNGEDCYSNAIAYDAMIRIDDRLKAVFIETQTKELTEVAVTKIKAELDHSKHALGPSLLLSPSSPPLLMKL